MTLRLVLIISHLALLGGSASLLAQSTRQSLTSELFAHLKERDERVATCRKESDEEDIKKFGQARRPIPLHCGPGCPVSLRMPSYPAEARRLGMSGVVIIEAIVDQVGKVAYARQLVGSQFFVTSALNAAYASEFRPQVDCDGVPIIFRRTIRYQFHPRMTTVN